MKKVLTLVLAIAIVITSLTLPVLASKSSVGIQSNILTDEAAALSLGEKALSENLISFSKMALNKELPFMQGTPDVFEASDSLLSDALMRIDTQDDDLSIVKYLMKDGTQAMRVFNDPIKFVDDNGVVKDKSMKIYDEGNNALFKYANRDNDVRVKFSKSILNGVYTEYNDVCISLHPVNADNAEAQLTQDGKGVFYQDAFGDNVDVYYQATYTGLKENIILDEYEGVNSFAFCR